MGRAVLAHHLGDLAVGAADQVVRADAVGIVLEPGDAAGVVALHGVDRHRVVRGAVGVVRRGHPQRRAVVGALLRRRGRFGARAGRGAQGFLARIDAPAAVGAEGFDRVGGRVQAHERRAQAQQRRRVERALPAHRALGHDDAAVVHALVLRRQHVEGEAGARVRLQRALGRTGREAGVAFQRGPAGFQRRASVDAVGAQLAVEQCGRGEDVERRLALHALRRHAEQARAVADLIGETLAVVQAHDAVSARHVLMRIARARRLQVLPARGDEGHRFQSAARNRRVTRVRLLEVQRVELAIDPRQRFLQAQALRQGRIWVLRRVGGVRRGRDDGAGGDQCERQQQPRSARRRRAARRPAHGIFVHVVYPREN